MDFAVRVNGKGQAVWVLEVDRDRLLIAPKDEALQWVKMEDCQVTSIASPDRARPVVAIKPQQAQPQIVVPGLKRGNHQ